MKAAPFGLPAWPGGIAYAEIPHLSRARDRADAGDDLQPAYWALPPVDAPRRGQQLADEVKAVYAAPWPVAAGDLYWCRRGRRLICCTGPEARPAPARRGRRSASVTR